MNVAFLRKWHRWIGLPASLFLLFASVTGVLVAFNEFFGADEAKREALRTVVSGVTTSSTTDVWSPAVVRALATVAAAAPGAPLDKFTVELKGDPATVTVFTGKPTGGEDKRFVVNAATGALISTDAYVDKPFLTRLHSGEWFGDGGLVAAMFWGLSLALMSLSGFFVYWHMHRRMEQRDVKGLRRYFW